MEKDYPATDYAAILADMEAKKSALEGAIASLRAALAAGALGISSSAVAAPGSPSPSPKGTPMPLPRGALLGKSGPEAIKLYLKSAMEKKTNKEIAEALKQAGVESTSSSFDAFVNSALFRLKNEGALLRFDDGWGLSEWYPESFRTRIVEKAANEKGRSKTKKKSPKLGKKTQRVAEVKSSEPKPKASGGGFDQSVLENFEGGGGLDVEQLAFAMNADRRMVSMALGRLAAKGKIQKTGEGYKPLQERTAKSS
jgi:hypothetical protein